MNAAIQISDARPINLNPHATTRRRRERRGRTAYFSGLAAEESVARQYAARGGAIRARRHRTPEGELDLIVGESDVLVFVEVKKRKYDLGPDIPITHRQWQRLENAANHYMMEMFDATRVQPNCRFDVALVDGNGQVTIIENARTFDEF